MKNTVKCSKKARQRRNFFALCIASAALLLVLTVLLILRTSETASNFLASTLSREIIFVSGKITGLFTFSFYETFLYLAAIFLVTFFVAGIVFLCRRKWVNAGRTFMSIVLAVLVFCVYYFSAAGFAYTRTRLDVPLYGEELSDQEIVEICQYFADDFNAIADSLPRDEDGNIILPYSDLELAKLMQEEYLRLGGENYNPYTPLCKTIKSSRIMSEMQISGVFFAPFGEAHINPDIPPSQKPHTMAHELAHAKGVMQETDANILAFYITVSSANPYLRYSAYMWGITNVWNALNIIGQSEKYNELSRGRSQNIVKERNNNWNFWSSYTFFADITEAFNDFYLRLMGQGSGTDGYIPDPGQVIERPVENPETGVIEIVRERKFSDLQKICFNIYMEIN